MTRVTNACIVTDIGARSKTSVPWGLAPPQSTKRRKLSARTYLRSRLRGDNLILSVDVNLASGAVPSRDPRTERGGTVRKMRGLWTWAVCLSAAAAFSVVCFSAIPQTEHDALVNLYSATGGASWTNNSGWNGPLGTEGSWYGVTVASVEGADHVTRVELRQNNLTGTLPAIFAAFPRLQALDMTNNYTLLAGPIPDLSACTDLQEMILDNTNRNDTAFPAWITSLGSLRILSLNYNELSGSLPSGLWNMTGLTKLDLGYQAVTYPANGFAGAFPADVTKLVNLTYLDLSYNQFTGTLPDLSSMSALKTLFVGSNPYEAQLFPSWVLSMTGLTQLGIEGCNLGGSIPPAIGTLTNLTYLSLGGNAFTSGPAPTELANLTQLQTLDLSAGTFTSLPDLGALTQMRNLFISYNPFTAGALPPWISNMGELQYLWASSCSLTGTIPSWLGNLTHLSYLYLNNNALTGAIPATLGNLSNLSTLYLSSNQLSGAIPPELGNCAALRKVYLANNQLTGTIPSTFGNLIGLQTLYLYSNHLTGPLPSALGSCTALTYLNVRSNAITGDVPSSFLNLVNLAPSAGLDLRWNGLHTSDAALLAFLATKAGTWQLTQTVAPTGLTAATPSDASLQMSWTVVDYVANPGKYKLWYSTNPAGPFTLAEAPDKATTALSLPGLIPGMPYYIYIQTVTFAHSNNVNEVVSDPSPTITAVPVSVLPSNQRAALLDLYADTNGDSWTDKTNWNGAPGTEGTWFGVTTDPGHTKVLAIRLPYNGLTGSLPASLSALVDLQALDLTSNGGLTPGPIPDLSASLGLQELILDYTFRNDASFPSWITSLGSLRILSLDYNDLSGTLPSELWNMTGLTKLDLGYQCASYPAHGYTGTIPAALASMANLTYLDLSYNQFTGTIPNLGSMSGLRTLFLGGNPYSSQPFPSWVTSMTGLTQLGLDNANLTGSFPALGGMTSLTLLMIGSNPFTSGPAPADLGNLTLLQTLDISYDGLTSLPDLTGLVQMRNLFLEGNPYPAGPVPGWIQSMSQIAYLYMNDSNLTGPIPSWFGGLSQLSYLQLGSNALTGAIPPELGNLAGLRYLYLYKNQLTGTIPSELGNCTKLSRLSLYANHLTGPLPSSLGNCTSLVTLYLRSNAITGPIPAAFANLVHLTAGTGLDLRWNGLYTDDAALAAFLNGKQTGGDWQSTQTVAPTGLTAATLSDTSASLTWTPITFTGSAGGYEIFYGAISGGSFAYAGATADKTATSLEVTGLHPGTQYFFVVRTRSDPHANNTNTVLSDFTAESSATTTGTPMAPDETSPWSLLWNSSASLSWAVNPDATVYRVYRGGQADLPNLLTGEVNSCLAWKGTTMVADGLTAVPPPGSFYFYVVVGVNGTLVGPAGYASSGRVEIINGPTVCPR